MTDKAMKQIEGMTSNWTFGVEVEMNHITREKAANVLLRVFRRSAGAIPANAPFVRELGDSYLSWGTYDRSARLWKLSRDSSIYGPDSEKCELITPVLEYSDIPLLQNVLRALRTAGAVSGPAQGCGVHIHVGMKPTCPGYEGPYGFSARHIVNLTFIMAGHEGLIAKAVNVDQGRMSTYCRVVDPDFVNALKTRHPTTMAWVKELWYQYTATSYGSTDRHYHPSRYHMLNLHSLLQEGGTHTVEFRQFQFADPDPEGGRKNGLHAGEMKSYIQLCLGMCQAAIDRKSASPVPPPSALANPRYAMRNWLVKLGFIGDEFETARELLTKRLEGNGSFRFGPQATDHRPMHYVCERRRAAANGNVGASNGTDR